MQHLVIFGATGNLGDQTFDLISRYPEQFTVIGMAAQKNAEKLIKRSDAHGIVPHYLSSGKTGFERQVDHQEDLITDAMDHLMVLDHGTSSLNSVLKALAMKKRVSIANKELMVVHGEEIVSFAREQQAELIPLDSEHNAIFQCLKGEQLSSVCRLILTASGGPFRDRSWEDLKNVTPEEVLKHPNWKMGQKTTVDSATLVNKAFEVIEAHHFFDIPYDRIEVRLHPESIVHAIVEFTDGNSKMIAYQPDMRFSLAYALFYPERALNKILSWRVRRGGRSNPVSFNFDRNLHFEKIEKGRFPCFDFVLETSLNHPEKIPELIKKDEKAVQDFLQRKIHFTDILHRLQS